MVFGMECFGSNKFATPDANYLRGVWTEICKPKADWVKVPPAKSTIKRCKQCQ